MPSVPQYYEHCSKKLTIKGCPNHACVLQKSRNDLCAKKYKGRQEEAVERKEVGKDSVQAASLNALNFCL